MNTIRHADRVLMGMEGWGPRTNASPGRAGRRRRQAGRQGQAADQGEGTYQPQPSLNARPASGKAIGSMAVAGWRCRSRRRWRFPVVKTAKRDMGKGAPKLQAPQSASCLDAVSSSPWATLGGCGAKALSLKTRPANGASPSSGNLAEKYRRWSGDTSCPQVIEPKTQHYRIWNVSRPASSQPKQNYPTTRKDVA